MSWRPPNGRHARDRGVSTTLSYTLTLAITSLLVVGLLVAGGTFVSDQQSEAVRTELRVVGQQLAGDVGAVDRLSTAAETGDVVLERTLPQHVAGAAYRLSVDRVGDSDVYELTFRTEDPDLDVRVRTYSGVPVYAPENLTGGHVVVRSNGALSPKTFVLQPGESPAYRDRDGLVVLEAESPLGTAGGSGQETNHRWTVFEDETASGNRAVVALPNVSSGSSTVGWTGNTKTGPRLDYEVDFDRADTYYVWVRTSQPSSESGNSDSVHVGLESNLASGGGLGIGAPDSDWTWSETVTDEGSRVTVTVSSPGTKTVHVWMREDGTKLDKVVLTTDPSYDPSTVNGGEGPEAN